MASLLTSSIKVKGHSVQKLEWKQMDGRMDGGDCITSCANAVDDKVFDIHISVEQDISTTVLDNANDWLFSLTMKQCIQMRRLFTEVPGPEVIKWREARETPVDPHATSVYHGGVGVTSRGNLEIINSSHR